MPDSIRPPSYVKRNPLIVTLIFFLALEIIIAAVTIRITQALKVNREQEFARRTAEITQHLNEHLRTIELIFDSVRGLYMASIEVTDQEFTDYLNTIIDVPKKNSIYNFSYAEFDPNKNCYQAQYHLAVPENLPNSKFIAADTTFTNQTLCLPNVVSAINQAVKYNRLTLSQLYQFEGEPYLILISPVVTEINDDQTRHAGIVFSLAPAQTFFNDIFQDFSVPDVTLTVADGDTNLSSIFFGEFTQNGQSQPFYQNQTHIFGNHQWDLKFASLPHFSLGVENELFPYLVFVGTTILNLLISAIIYLLAINSQLAQQRALKITADLRRSQSQFQAIYQNAPIAYLLLNSHKQIIDTNRFANLLLGFNQDQLLQRNFFDLLIVDPGERHRLEETLNNQNELGDVISQFHCKDKPSIWGQFSAAIVSAPPAPPFFLITITNITSRKILEAELQENTQKLEQINKLLIGRELKMAELKQQLKTQSPKLNN